MPNSKIEKLSPTCWLLLKEVSVDLEFKTSLNLKSPNLNQRDVKSDTMARRSRNVYFE